MNSELRQFLSRAKRLGFEWVGTDGQGHPRLHNAAIGVSYSVPGTPSDYRSLRNSLADLERLSGRKLPRANAAHYRGRRVAPVDFTKSSFEVEQAEKVEALVAETDSLREQFHELAEAEVKDYYIVGQARGIMGRYDHLRRVLADLHHTIPPIEKVSP